MPDPHIRVGNRLFVVQAIDLGCTGDGLIGDDVAVHQHEQEVFQVVRRSPQPILEAEHEITGILGLFHRQVLEHLGEGAQQL